MVHLSHPLGFLGSSDSKESACNAGDPGSILGLGRSPGEGIGYPLCYSWASLVAQMVKNLPAKWEFCVGKIPWRRAWQLPPVFLPGESPWTEKPGRLQSMGSYKVKHDWVTKHSTHHMRVVSLNFVQSLTEDYRLGGSHSVALKNWSTEVRVIGEEPEYIWIFWAWKYM